MGSLVCVCARCKKSFKPTFSYRAQKYCSDTCRKLAHHERTFVGPREGRQGLSHNCVGAAHELLVCADLLLKRFDTYRAMSPSAKADVVAVGLNTLPRSQRKTYLVQVTTGYPGRSDKTRLLYGKRRDREDFDVLAIVLHDGSIRYFTNQEEPFEWPKMNATF